MQKFEGEERDSEEANQRRYRDTTDHLRNHSLIGFLWGSEAGADYVQGKEKSKDC